MDRIFDVEYAGHLLRISLRYGKTLRYFPNAIRRSNASDYDVRASDTDLTIVQDELPNDIADCYIESRALIGLTARALLHYDCCIFHSASFVLKDKAYLLAAPSGTGKTTQYLNWQRLHPGEITMISGDMPVLELREDGTVWVHPSNWNGKENIGNSISAPLGGVVLLEQGGENKIFRVPPQDAILPFFGQFMVTPETEEQILALTGLMDAMLHSVPVWKLQNQGDDASTELLRTTLLAGGDNGTI